MDKSKLNIKDMKLLDLLDLDSRANLSVLSKQLSISNQATSKKIKQLLNQDFLKFVTFVDLFSI